MKLINYTSSALAEALEVLRSGGVVAHPTDTCYGLAANVFNEQAINRVINIKKMDRNKPMTIAVATKADLEKYGVLSPLAKKIVKKYFPGAVTLLVPRTQYVPDYFYPNSVLIGLRIPKHELTLNLIRGLPGPITTTSANLTGGIECYSGRNVFESFYDTEDEPDLIFNLDIEDQTKTKPSTIVRVMGNELKIIRQGSVEVKK
jgi:tRNA threonylcarbamoyl adenosine modification protein (Sua5/YciO/YrdC/YwlC family)